MNSTLGFRSSLLRCARLMSDEINTILLPYHLNYSLWQVMFVIREKTACTSIEMAEYLNVSKPSITKRVKILAQMDILSHVQTDDKRQKKMMLSETGRELFQQCAKDIDAFEQRLIARLASQDIQHSIQILHRVMQELEHRNVGDDHAR
ncbi:MarR family winged helix-turn-helix transcriptional regulator [Acinetobacter amyesii]|uniref:MarR family winged helix-turn-helix transcriptional regulator n=1 Tax=Acinetobacter amyesii TaxID=2942470 RepID=UPI003EFDBE71